MNRAFTAAHSDACQSCDPGVPDASPPQGFPEFTRAGLVTSHLCGVCGSAWSTLWHAVWPVERLSAPVAEMRRAA